MGDGSNKRRTIPGEQPMKTTLATILLLIAMAPFPLSVRAANSLPGCEIGWYVLPNDAPALLERTGSVSVGAVHVHAGGHSAGSSSHGRVVSLAEGQVTIEGICPTRPATVRNKRGKTKVRADWDQCIGIDGPVHLRASIDASECIAMWGTVSSKKAKPKRQKFRATRTLGNPL